MTSQTVFNDVVYFGVFLIAGFIIRELIKPLQRAFIPSSIIGGTLALILGQQVLGIVNVPDTIASYNGAFMNIIMTSVVIGIGFTFKKLREHLDYAFANIFLYGAQMGLGILLATLLNRVWVGMPEGWGILGMFSYFGSHGGAAIAGGVLEELGSAGAVGIGMVLATGGLIVAMTGGMFVVNYGVRKGWATFVKEPKKQPEWFYRGPLPKEQRKSIGSFTTTTISVNPIAFHLGLIMVSYLVGLVIFQKAIIYIPALSKISSTLYGMVGGLIIWPIMQKLKLENYVDRGVINQISGFSLEVIILSAMATIPLNLITQYGIPLLIHIVIICTLTILFCIWFFKKTNSEQWFEKCVMVIGTCTGSTPNGFALVRAIDPDSKAVAADAHGVYNGIFWWNNLLTPLLPAFLLTSYWGTIGISSLFVIGASILAYLVYFRRKANA